MDTTVGRYRIEMELGRGAMGVVYRAHDPVIDRVVALKTIRNAEGVAEAVYADLRERFLREAKAAGRLQHPNIVAVLDAGSDETTGISYIAMELVEGRDLESELRAGRRFTTSEAAEIVAAVADGLDYAHENGVVHRDVKPANILIDGRGRVRITDFGIARLAESGMTRAGQVLGSPAYMSPEQITGAELDRKSDIFSLGIVLYQLATGERPFLGEGMSTLAYQIVHTEPIPPRKLNPALSASHDEVLRRALAKSPSDRYARARDMAGDLRGGTVMSQTAPSMSPAGTGTIVGAAPNLSSTLVGAPPVGFTATGTVIGGPPPLVPSRPAPRPWLMPALVAASAAVVILLAMLWNRDSGGPTDSAQLAPVASATDSPLPASTDSPPPAVSVPLPAAALATPTSTRGPSRKAKPAVIAMADARLFIDFDHHIMDGIVSLRFDEVEVWTSPLRAVKQRRVKVPFIQEGPELRFAKEVIEKVIDVPAGSHRASVTVISKQSSVDDTAHTKLDIAPGETAYLRIRVGRSNRTIELKTKR